MLSLRARAHTARIATPRRLLAFVAVSATLIALDLFPSAQAHLALVRQGDESADTPEIGDRFGFAVTAGDFDGDGYDDLATGAPWDDVNSGNQIGNVVISPGSPSGVTHVGAYVRGLSFLPQDTVRFGHSLAAGDFDNDGFDDLAVGAPYLNHAAPSAGRIYIYYGSSTGLEVSFDIFDQSDFAGETPQADDLFGWSLTSGDFDQDGYDDLAIGAIGEDNEAGAVYVLYGSMTVGLTTTGEQSFRQSDFGESDIPDDHFGYSLAAGHTVFDPEDDLVIGTPNHGSLDGGRVYVVAGSGSGLDAAFSQWFDPGTLGVPVATTLDSHFGWSVVVGDFTIDQAGEIAVGEPGYPDATSNPDAGRVVVVNIFVPVAAASSTGAGAVLPPFATVIDQGDFGLEVVETGDLFGWSVAAGNIGGSGRDELVVGSPGEDILQSVDTLAVNISETGLVFVYNGELAGTFPPLGWVYEPDQLWDRARGQWLGYSVTTGNFDGANFVGSDSLGVAAGMPLAGFDFWITDDPPLANAGAVSVLMRHRQVLSTRARSVALFGCDDELVFSVRPFDRVQIASTAKIFPIWVACDHIEWALINEDDSVTVDPWIAFCFNGSEAGLQANERLEFIDLIRMAVTVSAGDACYVIADAVTGGTWAFPAGPHPDNCDAADQIPIQVPAFTDTMNARAAAAGALNTQLNNPAGRPYAGIGGEPYSTAYDMGRVARAARKNALFREIVDTSGWIITRNLKYGNAYVTEPDTFTNSWLGGMKNRFAPVNGVKPGSNTPSLSTRVVSALADSVFNRDVIATMMGVELTDFSAISGSWANRKVAEMCSLGVVLCTGVTIDVNPVEPPEPRMNRPGVSTASGSATGAQLELEDTGDALLVELYREIVATTETCVTLVVERTTDFVIPAGGSVTINVTQLDSTAGLRLGNDGSASATVDVTVDVPAPTSIPGLVLGPGLSSLVLPPTATPGGSLTLTVTNTSTTAPETLYVQELGYVYSVNLGDGLGAPPDFSTLLTATGATGYRSFGAHVLGKDTAPGNTLILVVRDPDTTTGVLDDPVRPPPADGARIIQRLLSYPNPFNPIVTIEYELATSAPVRIDIYDVLGRRVHTLENSPRKEAGLHKVRWDGVNGAGSRVASGVYFYRLRAAGEVRASRFVVLK